MLIQFLFLSFFIFCPNIIYYVFFFIFLSSTFTKITIIIIILFLSFHLLNIFYKVISIFHVPGCLLNFLKCSVSRGFIIVITKCCSLQDFPAVSLSTRKFEESNDFFPVINTFPSSGGPVSL